MPATHRGRSGRPRATVNTSRSRAQPRPIVSQPSWVQDPELSAAVSSTLVPPEAMISSQLPTSLNELIELIRSISSNQAPTPETPLTNDTATTTNSTTTSSGASCQANPGVLISNLYHLMHYRSHILSLIICG